jgi:dihydroflavonol-4-reductase
VGALGLEPDGRPATETTPVTLERMIGHYKRSKFLGRARREELAREGAPVVIVNPSTPVGELDIKPTPTGRMIVDFLAAACRPTSTPAST